MNFTIRKDIFLENLNIVGKAVSSRTTLPILQCVLIRAYGDGCSLIGNDLDMGIETAPIEADVASEGSIALDAKMLFEIVRKMPGDFVAVSSGADCVTTLKSEKSEFKILGQPWDEFPFPPKVESDGERSYGIYAAAFKDMIRQTIFSVALDDSKPAMKGELIELKDGALHLVSVDGFRISYRRCDGVVPEGERQKVIVPAKGMNELSRILPSEGDEMLSFRFSDKHIAFEMKKYTLVSRLLEGEFLRYDLIFNEDYQTIVNIGRSGLLAALERSRAIADSEKMSPVKLNVSLEKIVITSNTENGTSYEELDADADGLNLEIGFNPKYLIDALKAVDEEVITMKFGGHLSPCIIKSDANDRFKYLVVPIRLRS
ncbi:MAG: DNA polymerase III subunit beta [Firmicutes bacterium]|nr:DNA polymerase III subunit beta [Bacillota bacterium]